MSLEILQGDCRVILKTLADASVQCVVTSPPYWGLRDYGTGKWEGGDAACDHTLAKIPIGNSPSNKSTLTTNNGSGPKPGDKFSAGSQFGYAGTCPCGARRIDVQVGIESTPDAYVEAMRQVFAEVWRVLRDDGTLWLNLGDSYANSGQTGLNNNSGGTSTLGPNRDGLASDNKVWTKSRPRQSVPVGLKPKDLIGIPWRVAFALQADGWYLRQDIIWAKPNPMPESVRDRCTKSHEYLFLLAKSPKYFYDSDAIAEPLPQVSIDRYQHAVDTNEQFNPTRLKSTNGVQSPMEVLTRAAAGVLEKGTRNKRTVWTVPTGPYHDAHFATFPPDLIKPCILAGTKPGDTVLDPFGGSGTTGMVAMELGRKAILIELNPDYCGLAKQRTFVTPGLAI